MTKDEVRIRLVETIMNCRDEHVPLSDNLTGLDGGVRVARAIGGVSGFDSLSGIAATVRLEHDLGLDIKEDNIFLTPSGKDARTVDQIVDVLFDAANAKVGAPIA